MVSCHPLPHAHSPGVMRAPTQDMLSTTPRLAIATENSKPCYRGHSVRSAAEQRSSCTAHGALDLERLRVLRDDDELDVVLVRDRVLVDAVDADAVLGTEGTKAGNDAVGVLHGASGCGAPLVCA